MTWLSAGRGDPVPKSSDATALGPSEPFEEFYEREFLAVVGLAYALSGNRSGAEDLAQEAFLVAHRDWDRVGTYDRSDVWVRRVVSNLAVSVFRRRAVEAKTLARMALGYTPALPELSADDPEFWRTVRSLPRRQAQVIALHYLEDLPVIEVKEVVRHGRGHGQEAPVRRTAGPRPPPRARGGRRMTLDTRARKAAQGIRNAVEVMEMSTSTKEPRKVERFDRFPGCGSSGTGGSVRSSSPRCSRSP